MSRSSLKLVKKRGGRPFKYGEPTKLCRIPLSFEPVLEVLLKLWMCSYSEPEQVKRVITTRVSRLNEAFRAMEDAFLPTKKEESENV
jgi:hypothetical protein